MLRFISIENFALIERLEVDFSQGLNLITGETGSGKSILVDAVGLLVGERASVDLIRAGASRARIEGIFSLEPSHPARERLQDAGIEMESDELIIRREISRTGANKVFLNATLSTQSLLAEVGRTLADIHGQHDQQALLHPSSHLRFLDRFGGCEPLLETVAGSARELAQLSAEIQSIRARERERLQQLDQLRFQIEDIDQLNLRPGLDRELEQDRKLLSSSEKRQEASQEAYQLIYEDDLSVLTLLDRALKRVEELRGMDPEFESCLQRLGDARFNLEEAAFELRDYAAAIEYDPARLEAINSQLAELQLARRKYGDTVDAILEFRQQCQASIEDLTGEETRLEGLLQRQEELQRRYQQAAEDLSQRRRQAAGRLARRVERELAELAMDKTVFQIQFEPREEPFSEQGVERAEFMISANPGEPPRPLSRIASGGELSRVLLALKSILNPDAHAKTLVFDEVDAGIGGRVASVLSEKLSQIAEEHQVFCVTHLPQIAAAAACHFHVGKSQGQGRTRIELQILNPEQRRQELARMLAGKEVTRTTLQQASEMLQRSGKDPEAREKQPR